MKQGLVVKGLTISVPADGKRVDVVDDISFEIPAGRKIGLVGESGSGKSLTAFAMMRLVRNPVHIDAGEIFFGGQDILALNMKDFRKIRGSEIAMIYQDPMSALNPIMRVGDQIIESICLRNNIDRKEARKIAIKLLESVGIPEPEKRINSFPFEMSGGMLQRIVIAIALSGEPQVLIADEATTALDVTTQERILMLIEQIASQRGLAVLLITHDLGVAAQFCDDVMFMYSGKIVEKGTVEQIFSSPTHPYTKALLESRCDYTVDVNKPIKSINGQPPRSNNRPSGCVFSPRCEFAIDHCRTEVPELISVQGRLSACFRAEELSSLVGNN